MARCNRFGSARRARHEKTYVYQDDFTLHDDVVRLHPGSWVARNNVAGILASEKKYDEAIAWLEDTIHLIPDDPVPHGNLGWVLTDMGRYDEARAELELAMKLHVEEHEEAWLLRLMGELDIKQNRLDDALEHLNTSIKLQPEWSAFMNRGRVRAMRRDSEGALNDLNLALQLRPDCFECLELRAKVYASTRQFDKALADLRELGKRIAGQPGASKYRSRACRLPPGAQQDALAAYDRALSFDPKNMPALLGRGDLYSSLGQLKTRPLLITNRFWNRDPANVSALNNLAWLLSTSPGCAIS